MQSLPPPSDGSNSCGREIQLRYKNGHSIIIKFKVAFQFKFSSNLTFKDLKV